MASSAEPARARTGRKKRELWVGASDSTTNRPRCRCSRSERGQPKVPFSPCRSHILVIYYRWGSMGSKETATATTGGPRVIDVFDDTGRHRAQIIYFFGMQIGSRTPSGIGLRSGGPQRRMRRFLGLPRELLIPNLADLYWSSRHCWGPVLICVHQWKRPCMRCRRLPTSSTDPR